MNLERALSLGASERTGATIDPITFEVVRNKLRAIADEQAITLIQASGSPVVTDATDFNNGIYLPDGSIVSMGPQVLVHSGSMSSVIASVLEDFGGVGDIHPGDMFILNDPYKGAVHQPDMSIVAPIFFEGQHVAWTGTCAHQLDVGGMSFGGWAYQATEIQQEAMLLPGIKIIDKGVLREDLWRMILAMSRLPTLLGLDLKAMIAANNVAIRRVVEIMQRYGPDTVIDVMHIDIGNSERLFRDKLITMPDGVFSARDFIEHDGHRDNLYDVVATVHKTGDRLVVDFDGSSPQTPGFINSTYSGLRGSVFTAVLPILAPDIRWNHGIFRAVEIRAEEGTIVNATPPAPVSMATCATMWITQNVMTSALSRLAATSPATEREAMGVTKGSMMILTLNGRGRDGERYGTFLLDGMAGGGGAYTDHDGLDAGGDFSVPKPSLTSVEHNELNGPMIYLYQKFVADTGGPGKHRGGVTVGTAIAAHDADRLGAKLLSHGVRVPNSAGIFGGMVGSCNEFGIVDGVDYRALVGAVDGPDGLKEAGNVTLLGPKPGDFELGHGEIFFSSFQGGGGFGDPMDRDPQLVLDDVELGLVTAGSATAHYGVVLEDGKVDETATEELRRRTRSERLGTRRASIGTAPHPPAGPPGRMIGGAFRITDASSITCRCGQLLAREGEDWKRAAITRTVPVDAHGSHLVLREELVLREHLCPACGRLLETEVARRNSSSLNNIRLLATDSI